MKPESPGRQGWVLYSKEVWIMTRYNYTILIEEPGRQPRVAKDVIADNATALKRACNALLKPGSKITIKSKRAVR
jgi:hypothetical protein